MRFHHCILLSISLVLVYLGVFPKVPEQELVFSPEWSADAARISSPGSQTQSSGFRLGDYVGFVGEDGRIHHTEPVLYNAAVNDAFLINYSSVSENLVLVDDSGKMKKNINIYGYPLFLGERFFLFSSDRSRLSEMDWNGNVLWSRELGSIVTCIDTTNRYCLVGLLDGRAVLLDAAGSTIQVFTAESSRIECIYGCLISDDARYVVLIAGIGPQILEVHESLDGKYRKIDSAVLESDFRRAVRIWISDDNRMLYFEGDGEIVIYQFSGSKFYSFPYEGIITGVEYDMANQLVYVLLRDTRGNRLAISDSFGRTYYTMQFPAGPAFLDLRNDHLRVGIDTNIYSYELEVR